MQTLESAGADIIAVACNTVHMHYDAMQSAVRVPIVSIIDSTVKRVVCDKRGMPLILGTPYTLNTRLYQSKLTQNGVNFLIPSKNDRDKVFVIIRNVLGGANKKLLAKELDSIIRKYDVADSVLFACTELPLLLDYISVDIPKYDTLQILAEALYYSSKETL